MGVDLAASVADGLILVEGSNPAYVKSCRKRLGGSGGSIVVFAWFSIDADARAAVDRVRPRVIDALEKDYLRFQTEGSGLGTEGEQPVEELAVSGDVASCAESIKRLYEAGADSVVLQPVPAAGTGRYLELAEPLLDALR